MMSTGFDRRRMDKRSKHWNTASEMPAGGGQVLDEPSRRDSSPQRHNAPL